MATRLRYNSCRAPRPQTRAWCGAPSPSRRRPGNHRATYPRLPGWGRFGLVVIQNLNFGTVTGQRLVKHAKDRHDDCAVMPTALHRTGRKQSTDAEESVVRVKISDQGLGCLKGGRKRILGFGCPADSLRSLYPFSRRRCLRRHQGDRVVVGAACWPVADRQTRGAEVLLF
jgi:hypothetical protein